MTLAETLRQRCLLSVAWFEYSSAIANVTCNCMHNKYRAEGLEFGGRIKGNGILILLYTWLGIIIT